MQVKHVKVHSTKCGRCVSRKTLLEIPLLDNISQNPSPVLLVSMLAGVFWKLQSEKVTFLASLEVTLCAYNLYISSCHTWDFYGCIFAKMSVCFLRKSIFFEQLCNSGVGLIFACYFNFFKN